MFFGRIGGEEFSCILRETDHTSAMRFGERLRKIVKGGEGPLGADRDRGQRVDRSLDV